MVAPAQIEGLTRAGRLPPMSSVFVSHGGAEARHADYVGNPHFSRFIAEDLVRSARERVPGLAVEGHLICGVSLSGLAAAHIAVSYPSRFPAAMCQSGSFWYEPEAFDALVTRQPPVGLRFWLSVGDEETEVDVSHPPTGIYQATSQIDGVARARHALEHAGAVVHQHTYSGGHEFPPWREELGDALQWLISDRPWSSAH